MTIPAAPRALNKVVKKNRGDISLRRMLMGLT
jgi:hypothetical protein